MYNTLSTINFLLDGRMGNLKFPKSNKKMKKILSNKWKIENKMESKKKQIN